MPNTTAWSLPYPALTNAPNVPADIQSLATTLDSKLQLRIVSTTADVASPYTNQIVFATTDLRLYRYNAVGVWVTLNNNPPAAALYCDIAFPTTSGADTYVQMTQIGEQTTIGGNPMAATGTPGTITIREGGLYALGARGQFGLNSTGEYRMAVTKNSTSPPSLTSAMAYTSRAASVNSPQGNGLDCTNVKRLAVNDVLRMYVAQSSGGILYLEGGATGQNGGGYPALWAYKIRD